MIAKSYIQRILSDLDKGYNNSKSPKKALYYSKLAVIELCGWIEESMDDVVLCCAKRNTNLAASFNYVKTEVVNKCYGFHYKSHFRPMLIQVIGIVGVEIVETNVDTVKDALFRSNLGSLKIVRDAEAHTHLKGFTRTIDAPSVTMSKFNPIYDGLKEYDRVIREKIG